MERRAFLGTLAAGAVAVGRTARAEEPKEQDPARRSSAAAGTGSWSTDAAFKAGGVEVIAVCDVDNEHLLKTAEQIRGWQGGSPRAFKDWRELLDVPGLQGVVIATPPHWHALPFIEACRRGLDIYCEKPLAYDVREGRAMVDAAKASGRVVQVGFQRRHSAAIRQARQYIAEGQRREDRDRRRPDPLPRAARGPDAPGPAGDTRLGPVVRPRAEAPLQPAGGPLQLARRGGLRQRPPRGLGHPLDRRDPRRPRRWECPARSSRRAASTG